MYIFKGWDLGGWLNNSPVHIYYYPHVYKSETTGEPSMSPPCLCINNIKANLMFQCRESITLLRSTWHYLSPSHSVWGLMALIVLQIQFRQDITVT